MSSVLMSATNFCTASAIVVRFVALASSFGVSIPRAAHSLATCAFRSAVTASLNCSRSNVAVNLRRTEGSTTLLRRAVAARLAFCSFRS